MGQEPLDYSMPCAAQGLDKPCDRNWMQRVYAWQEDQDGLELQNIATECMPQSSLEQSGQQNSFFHLLCPPCQQDLCKDHIENSMPCTA